MNEKENRYANKLINRLIKLSTLATDDLSEEMDEASLDRRLTSLEQALSTRRSKAQGGGVPTERALTLEEPVKDWETRETGLHVFIGRLRPDDDVPPNRMNLEEYRYYINKKIYETPIHSLGKKASYTIQITKDGLLRMKEDHAYEEYVLDVIRAMLGRKPDSPFSDHFLLYFTDKKEENYGMGCGGVDEVLEYEQINIADPPKRDEPSEGESRPPQVVLEKDKEREKHGQEYGGHDEWGGKGSHSGKPSVNSSVIARMHYAYNIANK